MKKDLAILGAGGFGLEVAMLAHQINQTESLWNIVGFFDDGLLEGTQVNELSVLGNTDKLNSWSNPLSIAIAIGNPQTKRRIVQKINNPFVDYATLIHPSVILGDHKFLKIGYGNIICAGNIITTNINIGNHVILNLACTVGHETVIGGYSSFMPSCNISGEVKIGESNYWGTGSKVINRITVGDNVTIGAGAVVIDNIPDNATAVGVPARVIKTTIQ